MSIESSAVWRKNNPLKYAYSNLKSNSKRRGKEFTITYDQFEQFCHECEMLTGKGRIRKGYTVDRIENDKGYTYDNIQKLTRVQNSKKGTKSFVYDYQTKTAYYVSTQQNFTNTAPF